MTRHLPLNNRRSSARLAVDCAIVFLLGVYPSATASACLWTYATDVHGDAISTMAGGPEDEPVWQAVHHKASPAMLQAAVAAFETNPDLTGLQNRNDYAVALVRVGRTAEAVTILENLEKNFLGSTSSRRTSGRHTNSQVIR